MNLEDQLRGDQSGAGSARLTERIQVGTAGETLHSSDGARRRRPVRRAEDASSAGVHRKLGPWLFGDRQSPT